MDYLNTYKLFIFINENLNNKIIYHFTENMNSLISILKSDSLEAGSSHNRYGRGYDYISFTFNPNLWDIEYAGDIDSRYKARISFDYSKMSKKYSFKPFDYGITIEKEERIEEDIIEGIVDCITEISIRNTESLEDIKYLKREFPNLNINYDL